MEQNSPGYLRGGPLSANGLVHVPDFGDFQMLQIDGPPDPHPFNVRVRNVTKTKGESMETCQEEKPEQEATIILDTADPDKQVKHELPSLFLSNLAHCVSGKVTPLSN